VAQGLAADTAALVKDTVMRLVDDAWLEDESIQQAAEAALADTATGR
jgi:hypothetical protein